MRTQLLFFNVPTYILRIYKNLIFFLFFFNILKNIKTCKKKKLLNIDVVWHRFSCSLFCYKFCCSAVLLAVLQCAFITEFIVQSVPWLPCSVEILRMRTVLKMFAEFSSSRVLFTLSNPFFLQLVMAAWLGVSTLLNRVAMLHT